MYVITIFASDTVWSRNIIKLHTQVKHMFLKILLEYITWVNALSYNPPLVDGNKVKRIDQFCTALHSQSNPTNEQSQIANLRQGWTICPKC